MEDEWTDQNNKNPGGSDFLEEKEDNGKLTGDMSSLEELCTK